ncbi:hypothetical protein FJZ31_22440 [Candidatus Poribacteria bacterium]|nr:hypothetical protein [Candidatus Poribacteria bacterium]
MATTKIQSMPLSEAKGQNLSDNVSEKFEELLFSLEEPAETGNIFFISADSQRLRFRIERILREKLSPEVTIHSLRVDKGHLNIPRIIKESSYSNHDIVFIYGVEQRAFRDKILQYLNIGREFLYESKAPLVFWTTAEMVTDIADRARDLWAFRGGVFEFQETDLVDEMMPIFLPLNIIANQYIYLIEKIEDNIRDKEAK